jgi:hypothetical protein
MDSIDFIKNHQLNLIKVTKNYLEKQNKIKYNTFDSSVCYFSPQSESVGYAQLKLWSNFKNNIFFSLKIILKNILGTLYKKEYKIIKNQKFTNTKFKNIIITWGEYESFNNDGSFYDKYFNASSNKDRKNLWFIILLGKKIPKKVSDNCIIYCEISKKFSFIKLLILMKEIFFIKKFYHKRSIMTEFSYSLLNEIKKILNKNFVRMLMPYEGQPFQNTLYYVCKKILKKIKTIGYVHSFPVGLPLNLIFRQGAPDKLVVNGHDQYFFMKKYLGWKSKRIKILKSLRFSGLKKMDGYIYLPYHISSEKIILSSLDKIFRNKKYQQSHFLKVKNHPLKIKSLFHINLTNKIENYLNKDNKKITPNFSIFIGATGSIIEALESGTNVIHISSEPSFEIYSEKLWPSIKTRIIDKFIYEYSLIEPAQLIEFNYGKSFFKKYTNL